MSPIFYPDCTTTSGNGRFALEARSPHNGTIHHRDGRVASEDEFAFKYREHQSEFRYRLFDTRPEGEVGTSPRLVWERWQNHGEDSPGELVVGDGGWAILRTDGYYPEVIAIDPDGRDAVRVRVAYKEFQPRDTVPPVGAVYDWPLERASCTTAGVLWDFDSWRIFFDHNGAPYFSWRAVWGERLVLDLRAGAAYTDERAAPPDLLGAAVSEERRQVTSFLARMVPRVDEVRALRTRPRAVEPEGDTALARNAYRVRAAVHLVGVHRLRECVPYLRVWEPVDIPSYTTDGGVMSAPWSLEGQLYRPVIHHALKLLGEQPRGFSTYGFTADERDVPERFPMPECLPDRHERAARVGPEMSAEQVLRLLGSPDLIRSPFWEYDLWDGANWSVLRLTWPSDSGPTRLAAVEYVAPSWLESDDRVVEYLEH